MKVIFIVPIALLIKRFHGVKNIYLGRFFFQTVNFFETHCTAMYDVSLCDAYIFDRGQNIRISFKIWNNLPLSIRKSQSVTSFKTKLKTHLFVQAFQ